jgi:hypothetical protein
MANISLQDPNFVYVDNYFYTINDSLQLLVKKTFDGEIAFCYTLDIPVAGQIVSLDYDGVHFWSLERGTTRVIIRKWKIVDLVCMQKAKFEIISTSSETIDGYAFAVEHYTTKLIANEGSGQTILSIDDGSELLNDLRVVIGPNSLGQSEDKIVDSHTASTVTIKTGLTYSYDIDDLVRFYKAGYYFNNFDGLDSSKGSLLKIDLESGSVISRNSGTQFKDVRSAVFGEVKNRYGGGTYDFDDDGDIDNDDVVPCLMFIKGTLMFFSDVDSSTLTVYGSMVMDLMPGGSPETVYDLTLGRDTSTLPDPNTNGSTIYMLKSGYDYQVAQFDRMVNSISVSSAPAILPADNLSTSAIRASVLDQYNKAYVNKVVYFVLTGPGSLSVGNATTDQYGIANIVYIAGGTVADATITATVHQS